MVRRIKRRTFEGSICKQIVYEVPEKVARKHPQKADDYDEYKEEMRKRRNEERRRKRLNDSSD